MSIFFNHKSEEELTVHYLSQEIAALNNSAIIKSDYDSGVEVIREFKELLGIKKSELMCRSRHRRNALANQANRSSARPISPFRVRWS